MSNGDDQRSAKWAKYSVSEDGKLEKSGICPVCGPGVFAVHKNRKSCGRCGHTEMTASE